MEMIGRTIGNYRIVRELARGGMGTVYLARHQHLPREVVVKSILLSAFPDSVQSHLKARFRREAYIQSQLDHPNIVRVFEFFTLDDNYYLVMEYVPGITLKDLIARQGIPTHAHATYLCRQALSALDYAHNFSYVDEAGGRSRGFIHRDIKPANMLIGSRGHLKLTDFGIVKVMGEDELTESGFQPGTVEYMSPEQLLGNEVDERSDIYSVGVTLYEILTSRLPFPRSETGSDWQVRKGHIELIPPAPSDLRGDIHPKLSDIVMRSLEKAPSARFQTAGEFLGALIDFERVTNPRHQPGVSRVQGSGSAELPPRFTGALSSDLAETTGDQIAIDSAITIPLETLIDRTTGDEFRTREAVTPEVPVTHPMTGDEPVQDRRKVYISVPGARPKSRWPLAGTLIAIIAIVCAAGYYLLSGATNDKIERTSVSVQAPASRPEPIASPEVTESPQPPEQTGTRTDRSSLIAARRAEGEGDYRRAVNAYEDYLRQNPTAIGSQRIADRLVTLRQYQGLISAAESAIANRRLIVARKQLSEALRLVPESAPAAERLAEVENMIEMARDPANRGYRPRTAPFRKRMRAP